MSISDVIMLRAESPFDETQCQSWSHTSTTKFTSAKHWRTMAGMNVHLSEIKFGLGFIDLEQRNVKLVKYSYRVLSYIVKHSFIFDASPLPDTFTHLYHRTKP